MLSDERRVCEGCVLALSEDVDYYDWQDRYTEEQHERAVNLLSDQDEIECVISSYDDGQVIIHTPYVTSDVVTDFCNQFGFKVLAFGPQWQANGMWPCVDQHGDIFEIVLEYNHNSPQPVPMAAVFQTEHIDRLDGNDKQF